MSHQPFEDWIFQKEDLTENQKGELHTHLKACSDCKSLKNAALFAENELKRAPVTKPEKGFSNRWSIYAEKKREQQLFQTRRFMLFLGLGTVTAVISFILYLIFNNQSNSIVFSMVNQFSQIYTTWHKFIGMLSNLYINLPSSVTMSIWITATCILSVLTVIWAVSMWKFSIRGVISK